MSWLIKASLLMALCLIAVGCDEPCDPNEPTEVHYMECYYRAERFLVSVETCSEDRIPVAYYIGKDKLEVEAISDWSNVRCYPIRKEEIK